MNKAKIVQYVKSQKSLHLYENIQNAFVEVLGKLPDEQFEEISKKLIVMAFHDGMNGQVMHFDPRASKFAVMQLYIPKNMPQDILNWVVAHEIGHVMQGRNWQEADGMSLEEDATAYAKKIGYAKTDRIAKWLSRDSY